MKFFKHILLTVATAMTFTSCDDYLDVTPPSSVSPEMYFTTAEQLGYYTLNYYCNYSAWDANGVGGQFPSHSDYTSFIHDDGATDNEGAISSIYYEGQDYKVGQSGGLWNFDRINDLNWFIRTVRPKIEAEEIGGSDVAAIISARVISSAHRNISSACVSSVTSLSSPRAFPTTGRHSLPRRSAARVILLRVLSSRTLTLPPVCSATVTV